jgi:hypothetical protein
VTTITKVQSDRDLRFIPSGCVIHKASSLSTRSMARWPSLPSHLIWPAWVGGLILGLLAAAVLLRTEPLGVTSELSRAARFLGNHFVLLPERMEGLDAIRGCASPPGEGLFSRGFLFVCALVFGSLGSALLAGELEFEWPSPSGAFLALLGGVFLGWGAMVSFGCTIGTLLSGIHASSLSGWLY